MKFNIKNYKGRYAMHCKTKEEARDFCNYLHNIGKRWNNYTSYLDKTDWSTYKSNTVYLFHENLYWSINNAKQNGYTILEWEDFMNKEFTKADLKTGDVIRRRNGSVEILNRELGTLICDNGGWNNFEHIREDLTDDYVGKECDIIEVRRPKDKCDCCFDAMRANAPRGILVYERKEVEEMTLAEVCKLLGKEIKIVK